MKTTPLVLVCDACFCASCIQGEFYCEDYRKAGATEKTIAELQAMARESPHYWERGLL